MAWREHIPSVVGAVLLGAALAIPMGSHNTPEAPAPTVTTITAELNQTVSEVTTVNALDHREMMSKPWRNLHAWIVSNDRAIAEIRDSDWQTRDELLCLATNIYHEARGSTEADQIATANVVMNRVNGWAWSDTVCEVVWENRQFSWTQDTHSDRPYEIEVWNKIQEMVWEVYHGEIEDRTNGATHYHTVAVNPAWSASGVNRVRIGQHVYMRMANGGR